MTRKRDVTADERRRANTSRDALLVRLAEAALVVGAVGVFVAYVASTLDRPLLETHAFRQTQTAYQARVFHEEGIDLAHPSVPVLGEPFEIPFEFPLFQAGASLVMDLGVDDDMAMRLTGLLCFLATALLLFGLVRHLAGRMSAFAALVAFVFSPFALVWSRTSMIEYLATAGSVGFAWALIVWRESRRPLPGALALGAGLIGFLVKPTTALFWILPALLYRPQRMATDGGRRWPIHLWTVVAVVVPIAAAVLWTRHADAVKAASPATEWLTSGDLRDWNLGTFQQRFDPAVWETISKRVGLVLALYGVFLPFAFLALARSRQRSFWLGITFAAVGPPLVFTNLYFQHVYYFAAAAPALAALVGLGAGYVLTLLPRRPLALAAALVFGLIVIYGSLELGRGYWLRIHGGYDDPQVLPFAQEIQAHTSAGDLVAVGGLDWDPAVLYYAHRRGHMVPPANRDFAYELIHDTGYRHLLVARPDTTDLGVLSRWRWVGALGPHMYAIADSSAVLPRSGFIATDDTGAVRAQLASGTPLVERGFRMPCGRPVRLPSGVHGTWIRLARAEPNARITVSENLVPLPARTTVFVSAMRVGKRLTVSCAGTESLTIADVIDARRP